jgi:UDP-N-acetylmuramoyl-L-alanyl-D-glutamate--2,6-diaminopimelate ligase
MMLSQLIAPLGSVEVVGDASVEVRELAYDTRTVAPGSLFFCVRGATVDGHDLAREALARGAVALVVERPLDDAVPQLVVPDVRSAMPAAAAAFFGNPSHELPVAGITGTSGKTTTAFLLAAILDAAGLRPGLLTNIERRVGDDVRPAALNTPEAIDLQRLLREMVDAGNRACVMEATSIASSKRRLANTRFRVLVFTNLSQDHLDFHGNMDAYFEAKRRLFDQADAAVLNADDEHGRRLAAELPDAVMFSPDEPLPARLRLRGRFNRANAVAAAAAARVLDVDEAAIVRGLESVTGVPGRFEVVDEGQDFTVIVDYAHKPAALEAVLHEARSLADGRVICVFGAGGDRDREKRPEMGRVAAALADEVLITSDNPRSEDPGAIAAEIAGALQLPVELDRRAAIERAIGAARNGDVVVIAGKGNEAGQEFSDRTLPFDDRAAARAALRRLGAPA